MTTDLGDAAEHVLFDPSSQDLDKMNSCRIAPSRNMIDAPARTCVHTHTHTPAFRRSSPAALELWNVVWNERWGAGVETQKNVRAEVGGWGRVPFNEPYAPSLSTIYDGA